MKVILQALLFVGSLSALTQCQTSLSASDKDELLIAHNFFRSFVDPTAANMQRMVWSDELAMVAQTHAGNCTYEENVDRVSQQNAFASVGENLAFTNDTIVNYTQLVEETWYNEVANYDFDNDQCANGTVCLRYKQVVWDESRAVGCGVYRCPEIMSIQNSVFLVCNYGPAANFSRQPYVEGTPCSQCPVGLQFCVSRLCSATPDAINVSIEAVTVTEPVNSDANVTSAIITLDLGDTTLTGDVVVELIAIAGTATEGTDFVLSTPFSVTFESTAADGATVNVSVLIVNDLFVETQETFELSIANITSSDMALISGPESVTVNITDSEMTVRMMTMDLSTNENDGDTIMICAEAVNITQFEVEATVEMMVMGDSQTTTMVDIMAPGGTTATFQIGDAAPACITITVIDDNCFEGDHQFTVMLTNPSPSTIAIDSNDDDVTVTITDSDDATIEFAELDSQIEVNEGDSVQFELLLTTPGSGQLEIAIYATLTLVNGDKAIFNEDFDLESLVAHCMIGDGDGAECLSSANVTIIDDVALEGEHSFTVTLNASEASAMGYTLGSRTVLTVIISDAADLAAFIFTFPTVPNPVEGQDLNVDVCSFVTLAGFTLECNVSVEVMVIDTNEADEGVDFTSPMSLEYFFDTSTTTGPGPCLTFGISDDDNFEGNHSFTVSVSSTSPPGISTTASTIVTITDDDVTVRMMTMDLSTNENDGDTIMICAEAINITQFEVEATVEMMVMGDSQTTTMVDIMAPGGTTATFQIGDAAPACINITVIDDNFFEGDHQFTVMLTNPSPSTIVIDSNDDDVTVTIRDSDVTVRMMTMDLSTNENDGDTIMICAEAVNITQFEVEATVEMMVMGDSQTTTMVDIMAPGGTTATFQIGDAAPACINITVIDDNFFEGDHQFTVMLTNPSPSTIVIDSNDDDVTVTIRDSDDVIVNLLEPLPILEPNVEAPLSVLVQIILSLPNGGMLLTDFNVTVSTGDATATAPDDYTPLSNSSVLFPSMSPSGFTTSIDIMIQPDMLLEGDHSFIVMLDESTEYTVGPNNSFELTITDEEDLRAFHFNMLPVENSVEGTDTTALVCAVVSFTLTGLSIPVTVQLIAQDGQLAVLGADYTLPQSLQYVFNTSTMSGDRLCLEFGILDDDNFEGDHSFVVSVSPPTSPPGITIGTDGVEVTIEDDDVTVQMMSMDMTTNENDASTLMICAEAPNVNMFEITAIVCMDVDGDALTTTMVDIMAPGGRMATFQMGQALPACINITIADDDDFEGDHQFTVTLVNPLPSTQRLVIDPNDDSITVTITDVDDATVSLSKTSLTGNEGDTVSLCATLSLSGMLQVPISVTFGLQDNTTSPTDYDLVNGLIATFNIGSPNGTEACVNISLLTDSILEADQVLYATIESTSPPTSIIPAMTSITITDGNLLDAVVGFTSPQYTAAENSSVIPCVVLTDLPAGGSEVEIQVSVCVVDGSAVLGVDFMDVGSTSVVFPPGSFALLVNDERCVQISLLEDDVIEGDEQLTLHLEATPSIIFNPIYSTVTIQDTNTALVGFMPSTYSADEGQSDSVQVCLRIFSLPSNGLETDVAVALSTVNGVKTGLGEDFTVSSPFQVIFPLITTIEGDIQCANITIINDDELEGDEQNFNVGIMSVSPDNVVPDATADEATVTIADDDADDATVRFAMPQVSAMEGQPGTTVTQICLTINSIPADGISCPVTVTLATRASDNLKEAIENQDFQLVETFEVVFEVESNNGDDECAAVSIIDDNALEGPHGFEVYVESTNPPITVDNTASTTIVTISDNDVGEVRVTGTVQYTLYEGEEDTISVCVELTSLPPEGLECAITTHFEPQSLTAIQIEDYEDFSLYIEIPATTPLNTEVCMANVSVPIVDDMILEDVQSLSLSMTSATINGYDINVGSQSSVELQIVDNDNATVGLTNTDYYGTEGQTAMVCVFLSDVPSGGSQRDIEVTLSLADSVAVLDEDYALSDSLTVTFQPGNFSSLNYTEECIEIPLLNDTSIEGDHRFYIDQLSTVPSLELGRTSAYVTIRDINVAAVRLVPIVVVLEPVHFTTDITVTVRLDLEAEDELAINITVPLTTINGTAVSPADFSEVTSPFQVVFPVGSVDDATQDVTINIHPDSALEGDHHFNVTLLESPYYVLEEPSNMIITIEDERTTTAFLQLRLQPVDNCTRWIADNPAQKMMDIRRAVAEAARRQCFCNFTEANVINGQFNCRNLMTEVVFNAEIVFSTVSTLNFGASNLLTIITTWVGRSSALQVAGSTLTADPTCQTRSNSLTSNDCIPPVPSNALNAGEIVGIVIGVLVILVIIVVVVIIILVVIVKRTSDSYSFGPPKKMRVSDDVVLPNVNLYVVEDSGELAVVEGKV